MKREIDDEGKYKWTKVEDKLPKPKVISKKEKETMALEEAISKVDSTKKARKK